jgi:hypothetical protein
MWNIADWCAGLILFLRDGAPRPYMPCAVTCLRSEAYHVIAAKQVDGRVA